MQFCKPSWVVENKTSSVAYSPRLFPHTDTLHQPVETGKKAGEMTQQIKSFFHIHHGVFMWNESGKGGHDHNPLLELC